MADMYDKIDAALKERGMSRRQLAIKAGIPVNTLSAAYSRRSQNFSRDYIKRIANVLGLSWVELVFDVEVEELDREFLNKLPSLKECAALPKQITAFNDLISASGYCIQRLEGMQSYYLVFPSGGFTTIEEETVEAIVREVCEVAVLHMRLAEKEDWKDTIERMSKRKP